MSVHVIRPRRRRREEGIALVVVLLFTAVVLTIVVSTTATLALGARGGGVNERAAYQALLAAESGLNTFAVRYAAKMQSLPDSQKLRGKISPAQLNSWLAAQGMTTETTKSDGTKDYSPLRFEGVPGDLTLVSFGKMGTMASKVALQNYEAYSSPAYNIRVDAPLLSYPNVDVRNNANVLGESLGSSTGMITVAQLNAPAGLTIPASTNRQAVPVAVELPTDSSFSKVLLAVGDYVQMGGNTYKVTARQGFNVTLETLMGNGTQISVPNDTPINRIDSAVTASPTFGTPTVVPVSDPTFFFAGSVISIAGKLATVSAIDTTQKTVSVTWKDGAPSSVPEGTPIKRDIKGVVSGYGVEGSGTNIGNGSSADDLRVRNLNPFNPSADTPETDLFTYTFGQTKAEMLKTPQRPNGWQEATPTSAFNGKVDGGIVFINDTLSLTGSKSLCGKGILIVRGNLTVNGTCDEGFSGAIYVMGDYDQQGNSTIKGAVVAEGATEITRGTECIEIPPTDDKPGGNICDTKIAGTGQGDGKITFDRGALLEAGSLLTPPTFNAIQGTWRQR